MAKDMKSEPGAHVGGSKGQNQGSGLKIDGGRWGKSKATEKLASGNEGVKGRRDMGPVKKS